MKKWKIANRISLIVCISYLLPIIYWLIESIIYNVNGWRYIIPGPSLFKWYDIFMFNCGFYLKIFTIPAIVIFIVFIISTKKIKDN